MHPRRIIELRRRIQAVKQSVAHFERIESELRSMNASDDPARSRELMQANAEVLNTARARLGTDQGELARLMEDERREPN